MMSFVFHRSFYADQVAQVTCLVCRETGTAPPPTQMDVAVVFL